MDQPFVVGECQFIAYIYSASTKITPQGNIHFNENSRSRQI